MSHLEIVVEIEHDDGRMTGHMGTTISFRGLADGQSVGHNSEDVLCLSGFGASLAGDGRYMMYNCNCGNFDCGGYRDGVDVEYLGSSVKLTSADWAEAPVYEFDADQFREAVETAIESCRRQLPDVVANVEFPCQDDASVFGLNSSIARMPRAQQRASEPGGLFDRDPELGLEWAEDYAQRSLRLWSDAYQEVRARGLNPALEPGKTIVNEIVNARAVELQNEDPEDWYRARAE